MLTVTVTYSPLNTERHAGADLRLRRTAVIYACCNENRRAAVLGNPTLNGIDYLEVLDHEASGGKSAAADAAGALPEIGAHEPDARPTC